MNQASKDKSAIYCIDYYALNFHVFCQLLGNKEFTSILSTMSSPGLSKAMSSLFKLQRLKKAKLSTVLNEVVEFDLIIQE